MTQSPRFSLNFTLLSHENLMPRDETELHTMCPGCQGAQPSRCILRFVAIPDKRNKNSDARTSSRPRLLETFLPRNLHDAVAEEEHLGGLHCGSGQSHGARDHGHDARGVACNKSNSAKTRPIKASNDVDNTRTLGCVPSGPVNVRSAPTKHCGMMLTKMTGVVPSLRHRCRISATAVCSSHV